MTVNEALSLIKVVKERLSELKSLRDRVAVKETSYYDNKEKIINPQYDVKAVDKKISQLETFLFEADSKIKQANAVTQVDINYAVGDLLQSLQ